MSQLFASFRSSPGSRRRLRPRIWRTATSAATAVMSTSTLTGGQSQPSPSSPRVPNSTRISPSASSCVAHAVHACEPKRASAWRSTTSPSPGSRRSPAANSGQPASAASRSAHQSTSPGRTANVSPVTSAARVPMNRSSAPSDASRPRAPPVSASGESAVWRGGCSESHSTTARSPGPRVSYSQASASHMASGLAAEFSSTRSTSPPTRRMPWRVSAKPRSPSATCSASSRVAASALASARRQRSA